MTIFIFFNEIKPKNSRFSTFMNFIIKLFVFLKKIKKKPNFGLNIIIYKLFIHLTSSLVILFAVF